MTRMKKVLLIGAAVIVGVAVFLLKRKPDASGAPAELAALSDAELAQVDIARMNLICAQGIPGSESLDADAVLKLLDEWATVFFDLSSEKASACRIDRMF